MPARKVYLGDSVYAALDDAGQIILTTENGAEPSNTIFLERAVFDALVMFAETVMGWDTP